MKGYYILKENDPVNDTVNDPVNDPVNDTVNKKWGVLAKR